MSKVGKKPIILNGNVSVKIDDEAGVFAVKGPLGELSIPALKGVGVEIADNKIVFSLRDKDKSKQSRSNWGTIRSLLANAVVGVEKGFEKTLILDGVGYRMEQKDGDLVLSLGFSHSVNFKAPVGITFEVTKGSSLKVKGFDKNLVGETAAKIRALKKPEPYKGKGFHYSGEIIRRKAGKKAAGAAS